MVGRPSLWTGSGRKALPEVRDCREALPEVCVAHTEVRYAAWKR